MKSVKEANTEVIQLIEKSKYQEAIDFLTTKMGGQPKELLALFTNPISDSSLTQMLLRHQIPSQRFTLGSFIP